MPFELRPQNKLMQPRNNIFIGFAFFFCPEILLTTDPHEAFNLFIGAAAVFAASIQYFP